MKSNVRPVIITESEISANTKAYLDAIRKEHDSEKMKPGEFTLTMFQAWTGLRQTLANATLKRKIEAGELTVRNGRNEGNIPCKLYKVVK